MYRPIKQGFGVPESLLLFSCLRGGIDEKACYGCFFAYFGPVVSRVCSKEVQKNSHPVA